MRDAFVLLQSNAFSIKMLNYRHIQLIELHCTCTTITRQCIFFYTKRNHEYLCFLRFWKVWVLCPPNLLSTAFGKSKYHCFPFFCICGGAWFLSFRLLVKVSSLFLLKAKKINEHSLVHKLQNDQQSAFFMAEDAKGDLPRGKTK